MKTKITFLGLLSLLLIMSTACQKDDTPSEDAPSCSYPKNAKLKRIVACLDFDLDCPAMECDDINWIEEEYEYDSSGKIKKVMFHPKYEDGVLTNQPPYQLYEYNSKGQLVNIEDYIFFRDEYLHHRDITYTYSNDGQKIKEYIDYSDSDSFQYTLYKYTNNRLTRIENYEYNTDELEYYIINEYDDSGNRVKELYYNKGDGLIYTCEHIFENGLNVQSYEGNIGEIIKTYDENNNLILFESFYILASSKMSKRLKYEYYD